MNPRGVTSATVFHSSSPDETRLWGRVLGAALIDGDVVVLDGALGAGKTTFTQGIALGMGLSDSVTSPTFVVAREMSAGETGVQLLHVDAYRVRSLNEWDDLDLDMESAATVVEWGERVADALPTDRLDITLTNAGADDARELSVIAHGPRSERLLAALVAGWRDGQSAP